VHSSSGAEIAAAKIPSRAGELILTLEPLPKLIGELRQLFPESRVVGWKYELVGTRDEVLAAAALQMRRAGTELCVVNGAAFGAGFGVCQEGAELVYCADKSRLCDYLAPWAQHAVSPGGFPEPA
jgi:hypothetical protein